MTTFSFAPILPVAVLIGLGLLCLALTIWSIRQKHRGTGLRLGAALLMLCALSAPQVNRTDTKTQKDIVFVLMDNSTSQSLGERTRQATLALEDLKQQIATYPDLELRLIDLAPAPDEDKSGTRIFNRVKQALAGIDTDRYAGAILISDGQIHDVTDGEGLPGPLNILINGSKNDLDRRIQIVEAPRYAIVGKPVLLRVRVLDNDIVNNTAPLYLQHEDGTKQRFTPAEDGIQETVYIADHAGSRVLLLQTPLMDNELSKNNNQVALSIDGVRDRLRVLLVSGLPHQGQRTWRNILRSDPAVDLVHFTILRPSEKEDFTPLKELSLIAFPVRELFEEKLDEFDLIIFDRYYRHNVLNEGYFKNIVRYVRQGGALLISAGPDFAGARSLAQTGLRTILPAYPGGTVKGEAPFHVQKTDIGKRHPITTHLNSPQKNWGRWMRVVESQNIAGQTILESDNKHPLLVVERIQQGRIAMLLSDQIWLWARGFDGGGPHDALVRNLVHWLMKEPELEENTLKLHQTDEQTIEAIRHSLHNDNSPVNITLPDGTQQQLVLQAKGNGIFSQSFDAPQMGIYHGEDTKNRTTLIKGSLNPKELENPRASEAPLRPLIEKTGGNLHWLEDGKFTIERRLTTGKKSKLSLPKRQKKTVLGIKQTPLLPVWLLFITAGLLWCLTWWRESR